MHIAKKLFGLESWKCFQCKKDPCWTEKKRFVKNVNRLLRCSHLKNCNFRRRRAIETAPTVYILKRQHIYTEVCRFHLKQTHKSFLLPYIHAAVSIYIYKYTWKRGLMKMATFVCLLQMKPEYGSLFYLVSKQVIDTCCFRKCAHLCCQLLS
jgi:hypothetical protein